MTFARLPEREHETAGPDQTAHDVTGPDEAELRRATDGIHRTRDERRGAQDRTLTIPHHGSENNFNAELLTRVDPSFCVVAADAVGKWRHPGSAIVQAVASHGLFLSVVTSETPSEVEERGEVR